MPLSTVDRSQANKKCPHGAPTDTGFLPQKGRFYLGRPRDIKKPVLIGAGLRYANRDGDTWSMVRRKAAVGLSRRHEAPYFRSPPLGSVPGAKGNDENMARV